MTRTEQLEAFARKHPHVAFGVLLLPITFGLTGDPTMALFVGGAVAFGPAIAEGLQESDLGDDTETDGGDSE
jgi:hypothetical protein